MNDIEVTAGESVQRHELDGLEPHEVAGLLGHDLSEGGGVSIEPSVVVVHTPQPEGRIRQTRHRIGG